MKFPFVIFAFGLLFVSAASMHAQRSPAATTMVKRPAAAKPAEIGQTAVVVDESLSVLRDRPSLYAQAVMRVGRGRKVQILGSAEADGVKFYRVAAPSNFGWIQADAVFGKFRPGDEERLARMVQAAEGFDQLEIAVEFFMLYPNSKFRSSTLLLYGDLIEVAAAKLSKDASSRLKRPEMAASAAPVHSYYLNFNMLDRYRKLGIVFVFNSATRQYHYDGASWAEIISKFPASPEAAEAKKRMESLKQKMERIPAK